LHNFDATTSAIEDSCAEGPALAFAATGSEVVGVGVDADGLLPDGLPQSSTELLYVTSSHQFPTGHILSAERRDAIASWRAAAAPTFSKTIQTASCGLKDRQ
jgi:GntR family transcriptional regulator/MocR family aminotransferase